MTFPKSARTFFKLKESSSNADQKLLVYLVQFYNVHDHERWPLESDPVHDEDQDLEALYQSSDSDEKMSLKEATIRYPQKAVEALSIILGLDEDTFIEFRRTEIIYT